MARAKQPSKPVPQMTIAEWEIAFPTDDACKLYLAEHRWPEFVVCPRCGNAEVKPHAQSFNWVCYACGAGNNGYRFSVLVNTIFENTNKPLRQWFRVIHFMLTSKKGISALQIHRMMGFGSYRTAWYMCHRIRAGMANEDFRKLMGIVEVDETFVGGLAKNRHKDKRGDSGGTGGIGSGKTPIVGAVSRKGKVVARVIDSVRGDVLRGFVRGAVSEKVSLLVTDQWVGYRGLDAEYPHAVINHSKGQYVVGAIHTNTIEGFWSIFKRGVVGTFHKVSAKYMPLYVAEFQFRYNNRDNADIFGEAVRGC
jgi:hypothetical protein